LDIIFANNKIRKACQKASGKLKRRLDDISASENMSILELLPGRLHALKENKKGQWAMDLDHPLRLILEPIGDPLPISKDGWLDLKKITAVKIIKVEDYHGK
jgi:proteic killer suppression protein